MNAQASTADHTLANSRAVLLNESATVQRKTEGGGSGQEGIRNLEEGISILCLLYFSQGPQQSPDSH